MSIPLNCFTAYDVRGRVPEELNPDIAARIGLAFCKQINARKVVVGEDMRLTSPEIANGVCTALIAAGIGVVDIGLCGTEEMYFAVFSNEFADVDGGIMITASHNPADYNGMKFVRQQARPVSSDSGLLEIADNAASDSWYHNARPDKPQRIGLHCKRPNKHLYITHLLSYLNLEDLQKKKYEQGENLLKLVVNGGNGCAGPVIDLLELILPFEFIKINNIPDGTFPNGVPNPLLPEKREVTAQAVREHGADLGLAWDGDFDRCFFYDQNGRFIEGYYMVGLLAEALLQTHPGATILHDPRLTWNTREVVKKNGGIPIMTKTGHAFIKEAMRQEDAVYGGEMSAHHYFRDFGYCDSGMVPWLLLCQLLCDRGVTLSSMVDDYMRAYPVSGEINSKVADPDGVIRSVEELYRDAELDYTDGVSVTLPEYRFNIRKSNTEPVLRLNVETRGDEQLLKEKTDELLTLIRG